MVTVSVRAIAVAKSACRVTTRRRDRHGRAPRPATTRTRRSQECWYAGPPFGSNMALDIDVHWHWNNPLNVLPATILLLLVCALLALAL